MSRKERASLGFEAALETFDPAAWEESEAPAAQTRARPKPAEARKAAEAAGFRSRESATAPVTQEATAPQEAPATQVSRAATRTPAAQGAPATKRKLAPRRTLAAQKTLAARRARAAQKARAAEEAPEAPKPKLRRRRTGRNVQFNIKVQQDTIDAFARVADAQGWGFGEAFEHATALLERAHAAGQL